MSPRDLRGMSMAAAAQHARRKLQALDESLGDTLIEAKRNLPVSIRRVQRGADRGKVPLRAPSAVISMNILFQAVKYNRQQTELRRMRQAASMAAAAPAAQRERQAQKETLSRMRRASRAQLGSVLMQKGVAPEMLMGAGPSETSGGIDPAMATYISQAAQQGAGGAFAGRRFA